MSSELNVLENEPLIESSSEPVQVEVSGDQQDPHFLQAQKNANDVVARLRHTARGELVKIVSALVTNDPVGVGLNPPQFELFKQIVSNAAFFIISAMIAEEQKREQNTKQSEQPSEQSEELNKGDSNV